MNQEENVPDNIKNLGTLHWNCGLIKQDIPLSITIDKKEVYADKDSKYCNWYKCTKCNNFNVMEQSNYCSNCGVKINWIEK